ncbi:MAG: FimB/Mfa2 family fimbrial subunit [Muribaculaceae bacterium]|nr:FimB/Mfa2 family fimbrial subunit [Muribaculaceae bacterium]
MNIKSVLFPAIVALTLSSCNNPVYDNEGDCEVKYHLRFIYDMNLKWADAFPSEVPSVNLYAFDKHGIFIREYFADGVPLSSPDYIMELDLLPGDYTLVAWCGLGVGDPKNESFNVTTPVVGQTSLDDFYCSLNTISGDGATYSDSPLNFLYHGKIEVNLPDSQDGATFLYTMPLVKDTNHIRIILQQLSTVDMDPSQYGFSISDANGVMAYDNAVVSEEEIEYLPWDVMAGEAGVGKEENSGSASLVYVDGVIADLSTARLLAGHEDSTLLTITEISTGRIIATVPLIHYALLSKRYYEQAYGHSMSDQEFLDREDEYILTFFLDENNNWLDSSILIHSWRIILNNYSV